jgi:predicted nucleotidyltransferase
LELYDHAKDPGETENIAKEFPQKTEALLKRLRENGIGKGVRK